MQLGEEEEKLIKNKKKKHASKERNNKCHIKTNHLHKSLAKPLHYTTILSIIYESPA